MSTFRRWAFWRRVQYGIGFFVFLVSLMSGVYFGFFYQAGNCFDTVMNENETGVDCGGGCVRICAAAVEPPRTVWAESFEILKGQYNAVAYVENTNDIAATPELTYTFELFDGTTVVAKRTGKTVLPPNSMYPIFEGRIDTNGHTVTDTKLTIEPAELWLPALIGREQFKSTNIVLTGADTRPRLDVRVENAELTAAEKIEVVATLFNQLGEPVTASQTFIDRLDGRAAKDIVFTWPQSITKTVRSCIIPTDVAMVIDLSGSMNNDGGDPPQPVTDTLFAAKNFIAGLNKKDQSTVITFATNAETNLTLSTNHVSTAGIISELKISAEAEVGYTNTPAALVAAQTELGSERHNQDARKVVVLLTDGLPTSQDNSIDMVAQTKQATAQLVSEGVEVYAIGLGKNVNQDFISQIASRKEAAFYAPTTAELAGIYQNITSSLCESGATRIDVIAKTPTNFTPLR